jgi:DNA-binding NarL/FixJ family response regulator
MQSTARFLIVDDHPLFREALHSAVEMAYPGVDIIHATDLKNAIELIAEEKDLDLVLLDLNIPDVQGFEGLLRIRGLYPRLPVVVVSGHEESRVIAETLSHGAAGFIPKSSRRAELTRAIQLVMEGNIYVPEQYAPEAEEPEDARRRQMITRLSTLTPQQMRVLQMLREGLLNKQIAHELQVGETTIKAHVSEILRKLSVYSRTQAVIEMSKLDAADLIHGSETRP